MKKLFAIAMSLVILGTLLVGCSSPQDTNENEVGTAAEVYTAFLDGVMSANAKGDFYYLQEGKSYTLQELIDAYSAGLEIDYLPTELKSRKYAYIDCGADGEKELLLSLLFKQSEEPEYIAYIILKNIAGDLEIVDIEHTYYRYDTTINKYGYIVSGGSNGAASASISYSFINADGENQYLYYIDMLLGFDKPVIPSDRIYLEDDDIELPDYEFSDSDDFYEVDIYNFLNPMDYDLDYEDYLKSNIFCITNSNGKDAVIAPEHKAIYDSIGVDYRTSKEIKAAIKELENNVGLSKKIKKGDLPKLEEF